MNELITVKYENEEKQFNIGTTYYEISKAFNVSNKYNILAAMINNNLEELSNTVQKNTKISFIDYSIKAGNKIYERGIIYIFIKAFNDVFKDNATVRVEHSINKGIYITFSCNVEVDDIEMIKQKMDEIIKSNLLFEKMEVLKTEAITYYKSRNREDKVQILETVKDQYITLYKLGNMYEYFYGTMPYSTSSIDKYELVMTGNNSIVLNYPNIYTDNKVAPFVFDDKLLKAFSSYSDYIKTQSVTNASSLNKLIIDGKINDFIKMDEIRNTDELLNVAKTIYNKKDDIKMILISGPSSSGKTTTSRKLALYLQYLGLNLYPIALDDYFKEREETPIDANGEPDFESIDAIDVKLFNEHLTKLLNGETVMLPTFNFKTGKKEYKTEYKMKENTILIFEGLHAFNPSICETISDNNKFKLYLSPLVGVNIDELNRIHTTDLRILRRVIRDNKHRNKTASETLKMFKKVRYGEEKYIFPFQESADFTLNTALTYEIGVLKTYVTPLLHSVSFDDENYIEAKRLLNFLDIFLPIASDEVPRESVIREFIGNGYFHE